MCVDVYEWEVSLHRLKESIKLYTLLLFICMYCFTFIYIILYTKRNKQTHLLYHIRCGKERFLSRRVRSCQKSKPLPALVDAAFNLVNSTSASPN
eukprot:UN04185